MDRNAKIISLREAFCRENDLLAQQMRTCREKICRQYGSPECFREQLQYRTVDRPDDPGFRQAYNLYETIFTLPEERESFEGFRTTMQLNADPQLTRQFGPFKEQWLLVDTPEGHLVGGVNFSIFSMPPLLQRKHRCRATLHITYLFVEAEYRSVGIASRLLEEMEQVATRWLDGIGSRPGEIVLLCEQNAPELMTSEAYFTDGINARIDQCDRLLWWSKRGYSRLRFNYLQPALSTDGEPCASLTMNIRRPPRSRIASAIIAAHLVRYFTISVLKNRPEGHATAMQQASALEKTAFVTTEGDDRYYKNLREIFYSTEVLTREPLPQLY